MDINVSTIFDSTNEDSIKRMGQVFTPRHICDEIIDRLDIDISETVCEPSVGKGIFVLYFRLRHLIKPFNPHRVYI